MSIKRLILFLLLVVSVGCENTTNKVPSYPVYMDLNILSMYPHFVPDNGYQTMCFVKKRYEYELIGYAGVLVWVSMDGKYYAADMCCSSCLDRNSPVEPDGLFAVCPLCGEQYDLSYGLANPTQGVSRQPLRRFGTRMQGGILQIRN